MRRILHKTLLFVAVLVCLATSVQAAIAVVQTPATASGNDATLTLGSGMTTGNHVVVAVMMGGSGVETQTVDLTGITSTEVTLHGPADHSGASDFRGYVFCFQVAAGDSGDTTIIVTTSGSGSAISLAVELSGATCTEDGTSGSSEDTASPYAVPITTSVNGSIVVGIIRSTTTSDFSASGSTTGIPSDNTDIASVGLGGYRICTSAGTCDIDWTAAASEVTLAIAAGVQAAAVAGKPRHTLGMF